MSAPHRQARTRGALPSPALVALALLVASTSSRAEEEAGRIEERRSAPPRTFIDLRVGPSLTGWRPEVCAAVAPLDFVSIEACGNGSGFLHHEAAPEIAHFRTKVMLWSFETPVAHVQPHLAVGFAELQVAEDAPGFDFFGTGPTGVETAGPEVGASLRGVLPLGWGFELIGEANVSAAYFKAAPRLVVPLSPVQPSVGFTLGVGF